MKSITFIKEMFGEYYAHFNPSNISISMIDQREFGFSMFEGWMNRHQSFKRNCELREFLQNVVPSDVYCSCAYYADPEADMDQKGWLGADLVFDIDADHISAPCDRVHDKWLCGVCGLTGKGYTPDKCPACGGEKFEVKTWPCEVCLQSAKMETMKLLDMLMKDFGFSKGETSVFFSGHRGYHIYVENEVVKTLDSMDRKEIVDYVTGLGLDVSLHGLTKRNLRKNWSSQGSPLGELGWGRRLTTGIKAFIIDAQKEDLLKIGLNQNIAETILKNKDVILQKWLNRGTWSPVRGIGFKTWKRIAEYGAKSMSADVDTVVTTDIHRLIRLNDTLHGKTGLKKVKFPVSEIEDFDPFKESVAFKNGTEIVFVNDAPEFRMNENIYGPYQKERVELPTAAALLLVCKDRAEILE